MSGNLQQNCCIISVASCFIHNKTAASKLLPIERALKTDILTILVVYQLHYSNTNTGDKQRKMTTHFVNTLALGQGEKVFLDITRGTKIKYVNRNAMT